MNIRYFNSLEGKEIILNYLEILKGFDLESIGGKLPNEEIFLD